MKWLIMCVSLTSVLLGSPRVIYVLESNEGTLNIHSNSQRHATLVMNQIGSAVAYFSDEPRGGTLSVEDFILLWQKGSTKFCPVPPVTSIIDGEGERHCVELRNPQYDAVADRATFEIYLVDKKGVPADGKTTLYIEREAL